MAKIDFYGKQQVYNWHLQIPTPHLVVDNKKSTTSSTAITDNNLVIKGDNLKALKALLPYYQGEIDLIYIDPTYNTGNQSAEGGFSYNDTCDSVAFKDWLNKSFVSDADLSKHDKWLCMMWPRLQLAKELLTKEGAIFISIDEHEQHTLRLICDEIFGEDNFIENLVWQKKGSPKGVPPKSMLVSAHEYVLVYAKDKSLFKFKGVKRTDFSDFSNPDKDPKGLWRNTNMKSTTAGQDKAFTIINPTNGFEYTDTWAHSREELESMIKCNSVIWPDTKEGQPRKKEYLNDLNDHIPLMSLLGKYDGQATTELLKKLFNTTKKVFSFAKPLELIKFLLDSFYKGEQLTVLDFFAGSGTTGHAALELDNKYKFILIEQEDYIDAITIERLKKVDSSVQFVYCNLAEPVDKEKLLLSTNDKDLPSFEELAKQACLNALNTPSAIDLQKKHKWLVGNKNNTYVFLIYEPTYKWLSSDKSSLTEDLLNEMLEVLPTNYEQVIIYATSRFMSHEDLVRKNVAFLKLPFNI